MSNEEHDTDSSLDSHRIDSSSGDNSGQVNARPRSQSDSSSVRNRRIVELIHHGDNDIPAGESGYYIRPEFYEEDVTLNPYEDMEQPPGWAELALEDPDRINIDNEETSDDSSDIEMNILNDIDDYPPPDINVVDDDDNDDDSSLVVLSDESDEHEDDEHEEGAVNYDTSLPLSHSYLGRLEESRGRRVLTEGSSVDLQLFDCNIVLLPGQLLPLNPSTWDPRTVFMLKECIARQEMTIGLISNPFLNTTGTTAEIRNYRTTVLETKITLEGRQRFRMLSSPFTLTVKGRVEILPEISLGCPYSLPSTLSRYYRYDTPSQLIVSKHPSWLLKQYDAKSVIVRILEEIKYWTEDNTNEILSTATNAPDISSSSSAAAEDAMQSEDYCNNQNPTSATMDGVENSGLEQSGDSREKNGCKREIRLSQRRIMDSIKDPTYFSYWLAANLPISNKERLLLLAMICDEQRLKWLYDILKKCDHFGCITCKTVICNKKQAFQMSRTGPQCSFVNEYGFNHDTLTVKRAIGLISEGTWDSEYSWFPGYEYMIMHCGTCTRHIGWCYRRIRNNIRPRKFYGLSRSCIELILPT